MRLKPCITRYFSAECARLKSSYAEAIQETPDEDVMSISARIIENNLEAYKKLAQ